VERKLLRLREFGSLDRGIDGALRLGVVRVEPRLVDVGVARLAVRRLGRDRGRRGGCGLVRRSAAPHHSEHHAGGTEGGGGQTGGAEEAGQTIAFHRAEKR